MSRYTVLRMSPRVLPGLLVMLEKHCLIKSVYSVYLSLLKIINDDTPFSHLQCQSCLGLFGVEWSGHFYCGTTLKLSADHTVGYPSFLLQWPAGQLHVVLCGGKETFSTSSRKATYPNLHLSVWRLISSKCSNSVSLLLRITANR